MAHGVCQTPWAGLFRRGQHAARRLSPMLTPPRQAAKSANPLRPRGAKFPQKLPPRRAPALRTSPDGERHTTHAGSAPGLSPHRKRSPRPMRTHRRTRHGITAQRRRTPGVGPGMGRRSASARELGDHPRRVAALDALRAQEPEQAVSRQLMPLHDDPDPAEAVPDQLPDHTSPPEKELNTPITGHSPGLEPGRPPIGQCASP